MQVYADWLEDEDEPYSARLWRGLAAAKQLLPQAGLKVTSRMLVFAFCRRFSPSTRWRRLACGVAAHTGYLMTDRALWWPTTCERRYLEGEACGSEEAADYVHTAWPRALGQPLEWAGETSTFRRWEGPGPRSLEACLTLAGGHVVSARLVAWALKKWPQARLRAATGGRLAATVDGHVVAMIRTIRG